MATTVFLILALSCIVNYAAAQSSCVVPPKTCYTITTEVKCIQYSGCVWNSISFPIGDYCNENPKCDVSPTNLPTTAIIPTKFPSSWAPTLSPFATSSCSDVPPGETCSQIKTQLTCASFAACKWMNGLSECANNPYCSKTAFPTASSNIPTKKPIVKPTIKPAVTKKPVVVPTKRPVANPTLQTSEPTSSSCITPVDGETCPDLKREIVCGTYSGCEWMLGSSKCVNKPECSKTPFPTSPTTKSPTNHPNTPAPITPAPTRSDKHTKAPVIKTKKPTKHPKEPTTQAPTTTRKPTSKPVPTVPTPPTLPTNKPTKIPTSKPTKSPTTPTTKKPTTKKPTKEPTVPTTPLPTFHPGSRTPTRKVTIAPTPKPVPFNCADYSGDEATCLLFVQCKWCSTCPIASRCQPIS